MKTKNYSYLLFLFVFLISCRTNDLEPKPVDELSLRASKEYNELINVFTIDINKESKDYFSNKSLEMEKVSKDKATLKILIEQNSLENKESMRVTNQISTDCKKIIADFQKSTEKVKLSQLLTNKKIEIIKNSNLSNKLKEIKIKETIKGDELVTMIEEKTKLVFKTFPSLKNEKGNLFKRILTDDINKLNNNLNNN